MLFHIDPLRLWVHKVLPVVYDDSLSYYEVLAKVTKKLNEVIDLTEEQNQYIEEFSTNLTNAINNWEDGMEREWSSYKSGLNNEWGAFQRNTEQYIENWKNMAESDIEDAIAAGINQFVGYFSDLTQTAVDAAERAMEAAETAAEDAVDAVMPTLESQFDERYAWKTAVGSPLVATTAAGMTDTTKVYVYAGSESGYVSGDWYYYDGTAWQDGGVYNSAAVVTDPTLSESGVPADAKAAGDEINDLKSAITPILSPSINLLNPSDNEADTYINNTTGNETPYSGWTASGYMPVVSGVRYVVLRLNNGEYVHATGSNLYWAIYDANKVYITGGVGDNITSSDSDTNYLRVSCPTSYFNKIMVLTATDATTISNEDDYIEYGDSTARLAIDVNNVKTAVKYTPQPLEDSQKSQARSNINAAGIDDITKEYQITDFSTYGSLDNGYYWNIETATAVMTNLSGSDWIASEPIAVNAGDILKIRGDQGATHKTRIWVLTDDDLTIVSMAQDYYSTTETFYTDTVTVPSGATKLVMTSRIRGDYPYIRLWRKMTALDILDSKILDGKKLSLLGDSISAYAGTIPEGNVAYYTGSNSGVSSPNQMWWKVLCDKTGMTPLVINGWSGSGINWQSGSHGTHVPMSDDSRCNGLHSGTTMPDVILIAGGVNDYTYAEYAQNEPLAWDGISVPTYTEPTSGKIVYGSFTEAYVAMIKKLQTNYPNAIVVALSTWFTMRGTDNGYTLTHTVGQNVYTQQMYNDKIRYVAEQMHIPYIDVSNIGFNRNNFYPTYAIDSASIPTHPNAAGQAVMGKAIAEKLIELVGGYFG